MGTPSSSRLELASRLGFQTRCELPAGCASFLITLLFSLGRRLLLREIGASVYKPVQTIFSALCFLAVTTGIWFGGFWLIGLAYQMEGVGPFLVDRILYLACLTLFVGLSLSASTVAYFLLYRSREMKQWLNWPLPSRLIVLWKGLEVWFLSCWAFLLLGMVLLAAYAQVNGLAVTPFLFRCFLYLVPFSALTAGVGLGCAIFWAYFVTSRARAILLLGTIICSIALLLRGRASSGGSDSAAPMVLTQLLPYFGLYSSPWLPSSWLTQGILSLKVPGERGASLYWILLASNALLVWDLLGWVGRRWYLASWDRQASLVQRSSYRPGRTVWDRVGRLLSWLPERLIAIALKDMKAFWRDPAQWPQGVVAFGILGIYFANLRSLAYDLRSPEWKVLIAYMNLVGLSLSMVSLNVRFLFPQMSLELRQAWMFGLMPVSFPRIFRIKCLIHTVIAFLVAGSLLIFSNMMLRLEFGLAIYLFALMTAMAFPLVAIPLGLGACLPQVHEENPLRIVSGVGGILALSWNLFTLLAVLGLVAWPVVQLFRDASLWEGMAPLFWGIGAVCALFCGVTGWIALRLGLMSLRRVETLLAV